MSRREPVLNPVPIKSLHPTQLTIGFREVAEKRREWRERGGDKGPAYLGRHMIPVVQGPKDRAYILDHHHLCRTLMDEGVEDILANVVQDLRSLKRSEFWTTGPGVTPTMRPASADRSRTFPPRSGRCATIP